MQNRILIMMCLIFVSFLSVAQTNETTKDLSATGKKNLTETSVNVQPGATVSSASDAAEGKKGINAVNVKQSATERTAKQNGKDDGNTSSPNSGTAEHAVTTKGTPGSSKPIKYTK